MRVCCGNQQFEDKISQERVRARVPTHPHPVLLEQEQNMPQTCQTGSRMSFCYSEHENALVGIFVIGLKLLRLLTASPIDVSCDTSGNLSAVT